MRLAVAGQQLDVERLQPASPRAGRAPIVMLHEGLGSVSLWKDFPQRLADRAGAQVIVYSRRGYGRSEPLLAGEHRPVHYMHDEALVVLPALLETLQIEAPILFGHSDGASIALLFAGARQRDLSALIVLAPHVFVEDISVASIAQARASFMDENTDVRRKLARHHDDVDGAFWGWNRIWLDPAFRRWNIEAYLPHIRCPVMAVQGVDDEYGTLEQIERVARAAPDVELVTLADCRHSPHRDQPQALLDAVERFLARVTAGR